MQNFTVEDLVLFVYNELPSPDAEKLSEELKTNWALKEKVAAIKEVKDRLNTMPLASPSKNSINAILRYAALTEPVKSE